MQASYMFSACGALSFDLCLDIASWLYSKYGRGKLALGIKSGIYFINALGSKRL